MLFQVFEGSTLVIEKMDVSRAGMYSCTATNSDQGKPAMAIATLTLYSESDVASPRESYSLHAPVTNTIVH